MAGKEKPSFYLVPSPSTDKYTVNTNLSWIIYSEFLPAETVNAPI